MFISERHGGHATQSMVIKPYISNERELNDLSCGIFSFSVSSAVFEQLRFENRSGFLTHPVSSLMPLISGEGYPHCSGPCSNGGKGLHGRLNLSHLDRFSRKRCGSQIVMRRGSNQRQIFSDTVLSARPKNILKWKCLCQGESLER